MKKILKSALALSASVMLISAASAEKYRMQGSFLAGDYAGTYLLDNWYDVLKQRTDGRVEILYSPNKSIVPHKETPKAVASGILDGEGWTAMSYFSGKNPAFALLGDLVGGYDTVAQMRDFCQNGGGETLAQKAYDSITNGKVTVIACAPYQREALVSAIPIYNVADLKGVKIRAPEGMVAMTFKEVGANPVNIAYSEVYTSLEKGVIDAADASAYANNDALGFNKVARYPLYPGIHSMPVLVFTMNTAKYNKLAPLDKKLLRDWAYESIADLAIAIDNRDQELVARDKKDPTITVIDWPQDERDKLRAIAKGTWGSFAGKNDLAKEVMEAHIKYMKSNNMLK